MKYLCMTRLKGDYMCCGSVDHDGEHFITYGDGKKEFFTKDELYVHDKNCELDKNHMGKCGMLP